MLRKTIVRWLLAMSAVMAASAAQGQQQTSSTPTDQTYLDFQVEQVVRPKNAVAPSYPERLRQSRIEGQVIVQYVVDERGNPQMHTFKVLKSSDHAFTESVKAAVSLMTFHPAEIAGQKVKQLVQQPFKFAASR
jgi:periplasmic protein TonB